MSTTIVERSEAALVTRLVGQGVLAGLAGGLVFGMMMAMMGMLPMVGTLVGQESAVIGFVVHMGISAFIGAVYALVISRFSNTTAVAAAGGVLNGIVWWVLGALMMMPLFLGMSEMLFVVGETQWWSLLGHIIYGLVTAFAFLALRHRS